MPPTLYTYRDAIEQLVQWAGGMPQSADMNLVRTAVLGAYRTVQLEKRWRYFLQHERINLDPAYATGTVAYNASTGQVTLTTGTWPTWVRYGRIIFSGDNRIYKVAEQDADDASIVTLDTAFSPAADVATGTSYTLFRSVYPLPADMGGIESMEDEVGFYSSGYVTPEIWMASERHFVRSGPWFDWTIMGAPDLFGQIALCVYGYLGAGQTRTFDFLYQRPPRSLNYDGYGLFSSQGANAIATAAAASVEFGVTGFTLPEDIVGSVLRMGRTDSSIEDPPGNRGSANPYSEQKIITSRETATTGKVDSNFTYGKGTNGHFVISDPIDFPHYLLPMFQRAGENHLALAIRPDQVGQTEALLRKATLQSRGSDTMSPAPKGPFSPDTYPGFRPGVGLIVSEE